MNVSDHQKDQTNIICIWSHPKRDKAKPRIGKSRTTRCLKAHCNTEIVETKLANWAFYLKDKGIMNTQVGSDGLKVTPEPPAPPFVDHPSKQGLYGNLTHARKEANFEDPQLSWVWLIKFDQYPKDVPQMSWKPSLWTRLALKSGIL